MTAHAIESSASRAKNDQEKGTEMTATTLAQIPNLRMDRTHYGVAVSDIGIDDDAEGTLFALGHVEPRLALAAFQRHARKVWGDDLFGVLFSTRPTLTEALRRVEHTWMVNRGTDDEWCMEAVAPETAGAFPATWWSA